MGFLFYWTIEEIKMDSKRTLKLWKNYEHLKRRQFLLSATGQTF
jgi:hypothetical protein